MQNNFSKVYLPVAIIILGFAAIFGLSKFLEENRPDLSEEYSDKDLSLQGEKLKGYVFGAEGLLADWYWMRSLQYLGEKVQNGKEDNKNFSLDDLSALNPRLLYPLLDNATSLDPQFLVAYSYGAVVLPAISDKQAIEITEKGIRNNPKAWRLYQHLGYIHWKSENYKKAAEAYQKGSAIEGSPPFMKLMVARMKDEGGSRETARAIYKQMLEEASDSQTKENAELRLLQLDFFDQRDAIQKILTDLQAKDGKCVGDLNEIIPFLQKVKLPNNNEFQINKNNELVDPSGTPYLLDKKNCKITLNYLETKVPKI